MSEVLLLTFNEAIILFVLFIVMIILPYLYFFKIANNKYQHRYIPKGGLKKATNSAIFYTAISYLILTLYHIVMNFMIASDFTLMYQDFGQSNIFVHILTITFVIFLNDAYFYWAHFALHRVGFLKKYHVIHHRDRSPTPFSAYNFHPVEAAINFLFYPIIIMLVPLHKIDMLVIYGYMLLNNSLGHLPIEFCPRWFYEHKWSNWLNAATHHMLHHINGSSNFSLYYLIWDKKVGTLNKEYYQRFNSVQDRVDEYKSLEPTSCSDAQKS